MTLEVSDWPFLPEPQRTPEQNEQWWQECYVPSPAEVTLRGISHSVIAVGGTGSGKSIAIKALEKTEAERFFIFHYPIDRWPGESNAWVKGLSHLGQIMACAAMRVKTFLNDQPHRFDHLSPIDLEFLRWLIEKHSDPRAFRRWANAINHQALLSLAEHPFEDLYPTDTELVDVQGQIDELVTLSRHLGFEGVMVLIDVNEAHVKNESTLKKMQDLFGWLTPLQFEGFAIKAAVPERIVNEAQLVNRSRGRVSFAALRWTVQDCEMLSNYHLRAATDHRLQSLAEIISAKTLTALGFKILTLYEQPSPRTWQQLTATVLNEFVKCQRKLTNENQKNILHSYFSKYMPLRLDRLNQGVWRGEQFIPLDNQPFSFLEVLWRQRKSGNSAHTALLQVAGGSQGNLNTIASRLRKTIEPVSNRPIYIHNSRGQGYWLENIFELPDY